MKPEEREQLFRDGFEAYAEGDMERALSQYSPEIEATAPDWMNQGTFKGHQGFLEWAAAWHEAWESWTQEIVEVRAAGADHVVARVRVRGRGRGSGVELDQEVGQVVAVDEHGKATYIQITQNFERALEIAREREVSN